uniref:Ubiquitin-like protease family profile domain-containing protein n=1 Tax=Triticum urartu TaxID=4572 RepID=A0A8R7V3Y8_TRIUA
MTMDSKVMGYRVDWLKKFMFPVHFMDCWSLYILDTDKKIVMVLDPKETNLSDEMKIKHGPLARKFQQKLCTLFSDMFGAGLVETTGWSFVYPLVAQHEPCSREDSGVYVAHYVLEFTGLYLRSTITQGQIEHLRKKIAYEIVIMKGN